MLFARVAFLKANSAVPNKHLTSLRILWILYKVKVTKDEWETVLSETRYNDVRLFCSRSVRT